MFSCLSSNKIVAMVRWHILSHHFFLLSQNTYVYMVNSNLVSCSYDEIGIVSTSIEIYIFTNVIDNM